MYVDLLLLWWTGYKEIYFFMNNYTDTTLNRVAYEHM